MTQDYDADAHEVLDTVADRLADTDGKTELTIDEEDTLGLRANHPTAKRKQSIVSGQRDGIPTSYQLYRYQGSDRYRYLGVKTCTKLQGEKYTRRYAIGVGALNLTGVRPEGLREAVNDRIERHTPANIDQSALDTVPDPITEEQAAAIGDWIAEGAELNAQDYLHNTYMAVYSGDRIYMSFEDPYVGFDRVAEDVGLSEFQSDMVTGLSSREYLLQPTGFDVPMVAEYVVEVEFA